MEISVYNECTWHCPLPKSELIGMLTAMYAPYVHAEGDAPSLLVHVVHDAHISMLNSKHMACAGPTNILSFPGEQGGVQLHRGQTPVQPHILVLSVDTFRRECLLYGQEPLEHLIRLLAHGLGHVLGYDHSEEMFALCECMEAAGQDFATQHGITLV